MYISGHWYIRAKRDIPWITAYQDTISVSIITDFQSHDRIWFVTRVLYTLMRINRFDPILLYTATYVFEYGTSHKRKSNQCVGLGWLMQSFTCTTLVDTRYSCKLCAEVTNLINGPVINQVHLTNQSCYDVRQTAYNIVMLMVYRAEHVYWNTGWCFVLN